MLNQTRFFTGRQARRTRKQKDASRRNGSKSRGPLTPEGKARSSQNAMKHGLLAQRIMPCHDPRGDDRLFRKLRSAIAAEFPKLSVLLTMELDFYVADQIQLARVSGMIELKMRPAYSADQLRDWNVGQQQLASRRRLDTLRSILAGQKPAPEGKQLNQLTDLVTGYAFQLRSWMRDMATEEHEGAAADGSQSELPKAAAKPQPTAAASASLTIAQIDALVVNWVHSEDPDAEDNACVALSAALGNELDLLCDKEVVRSTLSGRRRLTRRSGRLWCRLIDWAQNYLPGRGNLDQLRQQAAAVEEVSLLKVAAAPQQLILLQRYKRSLERSVEQRYRRLCGK